MQQIEAERWRREENNRKEEIGRLLASETKEVDIVAFRPPSSTKTTSTRVSKAPLAVLSPEERAKMELSAAIVTLSVIGLKFGGPLGAVAFASAARVYGGQGTAQGTNFLVFTQPLSHHYLSSRTPYHPPNHPIVNPCHQEPSCEDWVDFVWAASIFFKLSIENSALPRP